MSNLDKLFQTEEDFKKHVDNLFKVQNGLSTILESRPDIQEEILPLCKTVGEIVNALITERPYHPSIGFYGQAASNNQKQIS